MKNTSAERFISILSGISVLAFPFILMIAFSLHYESLGEFFVFQLKYEPRTAGDFMTTLVSNYAWRLYILPHLVAYLAVPFMIPTALVLGKKLIDSKPWYAITGVLLVIVGTIFLSGVFASWLSFAAIGEIQPNQVQGAIPALAALTKMQGFLAWTTYLSALSLLGFVILGIGLLRGKLMPVWTTAAFILGNILILIFMDLDNWMFIGALLMFIGMLPASIHNFKKSLT